MSKSYHARLHGNRIEWIDPPPTHSADETPMEIVVQLLESSALSAKIENTDAIETVKDSTIHRPDFSQSPDPERSQALWDFFRSLPPDRKSTFPDDPVEWQREIRKDRPLPGRDE